MTEHTSVERVRVLCEAAALPVSEPELEPLASLYDLITEGLDQLALLIQDADSTPLRYAPHWGAG